MLLKEVRRLFTKALIVASSVQTDLHSSKVTFVPFVKTYPTVKWVKNNKREMGLHSRNETEQFSHSLSSPLSWTGLKQMIALRSKRCDKCTDKRHRKIITFINSTNSFYIQEKCIILLECSG